MNTLITMRLHTLILLCNKIIQKQKDIIAKDHLVSPLKETVTHLQAQKRIKQIEEFIVLISYTEDVRDGWPVISIPIEELAELHRDLND